MKKPLITLLLFSFSISRAQTIEEAVKTTMTQFETAADAEAMVGAANRFELISSKWNKEWIGHYYAAFAKTIIAITEKDRDKKLGYFDEAEKHLETAKTLLPEGNDEVYALKAMIASTKIGLFPEQWQKYMEQFSSNLQQAKTIRKENPRTFYIEGMSKFYTPEAYGGGKKSALPYFEKAAEYFSTETSDDIRKPWWGKKQNESFLTKCKE